MASKLFEGSPLPEVLDFYRKEALQALERISNEVLLAQPIDHWINTLVEEATPKIPVLNATNITRSEQEAEVFLNPVPNEDFRSDTTTIRGNSYVFHVPFKGDHTYFRCDPGLSYIPRPRAFTSQTEVLIPIAGHWLTAEMINGQVDKTIVDIEKLLEAMRTDVQRFATSLQATLRPRLEDRIKQAQANIKTAEGIKYALKRREGAPNTYTVPAVRPKIEPAQPKATVPADPTLDEGTYRQILTIIENMTKVMERSPSAFERMGEEDIRVHYLVQLNGQFEGAALGEAFNAEGKTDILVRWKGHNLFIAECKFWDGALALGQTVDQLFKYITWRDTKTALIVLSRRRSFSNVIQEAKDAMTQHKQFVSGPIEEGQTRLRYKFKMAKDDQRHIDVTLMLFDVPKPSKPS